MVRIEFVLLILMLRQKVVKLAIELRLLLRGRDA